MTPHNSCFKLNVSINSRKKLLALKEVDQVPPTYMGRYLARHKLIDAGFTTREAHEIMQCREAHNKCKRLGEKLYCYKGLVSDEQAVCTTLEESASSRG